MAESLVDKTGQAISAADGDILPSLKRRLVSGGAWALGGRVAQALTALATNGLLARLLSPQELGAYFLAFSLVMLGSTVGSLGANYAVVRFVAESMGLNQFGRARHAVSVMCVVGVLGALGTGCLYLLSGDVLANKLFHAPALAAVTGLLAGWIVVTALQSLLAGTFRGFHDIRLATAFGGFLTGLLLTGFLALLWVFEGRADLATVMLLAAGSSLTSVLLAGWLLQSKVSSLPRGGDQKRMSLSEALHVSWPLFVTGLTFYILTQADLWIIGAFRPQEDVAVYGAASRMVVLVAMPLQIVNLIVPPFISEMYFQGKKRQLENTLRTTATLAGIPAFLLLLTFILLGGPILGLVYGNHYQTGAVVLALLSCGHLANVWSGSAGLLLNMTGHQYPSMVITLFSAILVSAVALTTVHYLGIVGVAAGSALGLVSQNLMLVIYGRRVVSVKTYVDLSPSVLIRGLSVRRSRC
jgi:O-antigen/teichoic acid export membrane protein